MRTYLLNKTLVPERKRNICLEMSPNCLYWVEETSWTIWLLYHHNTIPKGHHDGKRCTCASEANLRSSRNPTMAHNCEFAEVCQGLLSKVLVIPHCMLTWNEEVVVFIGTLLLTLDLRLVTPLFCGLLP